MNAYEFSIIFKATQNYFSNRPIDIQKIEAPTLLVYEMHTCMHAYNFIRKVKHPKTRSNHSRTQSEKNQMIIFYSLVCT